MPRSPRPPSPRSRTSRAGWLPTLLAALLFAQPAAGQGTPATAVADTTEMQPADGGAGPASGDAAAVDSTAWSQAPRVYLDCKAGCDFSYLVRTIPFANFVRDPKAAQVYVLITQQWTASGGRVYRLEYQGQEGFSGQRQQLSFLSEQSETHDARRQGLARVIRLGLTPFVAQTPLASQLDVAFAGPKVRPPAAQGDDPWDNWVFRIGAGGSLSREASRSSNRFNGSVGADRVTAEWKLRSGASLDYDERDFKSGGRAISSTSHRVSTSASVVKSLGPRWSVGLFSDAYSASYTNVGLGLRLSPALEFNIFPWDVSDRKEFTIAYTTGMRSFRYLEETIYGKTEEALAFQSLRSSLRLTQPWGSLWANLEGSHYLREVEKNRVVLRTNLSFRVAKGLSVDIGTNAESIHDQLYLPRGGATLEEILLQQRRQATTYELSSSVGLRYTFGSIYNNVINPRF